MAFEKGTKIRVAFTARVEAKPEPGLSATNEVREQNGTGATHYVYLESGRVTGERKIGGTVRVEFDAEVIGDYQDSPLITTKVREIVDGRAVGFTHYIYLDSPSVTLLEEVDDPAAPLTSETARIGDLIQVNITARIGEESDLYDKLATRQVSERDGTGFTHFLFLRSDMVKIGPDRIVITTGGTVTAEFTAVVVETPGSSSLRTTKVREVRANGDRGYSHFVFLDSPSVTRAGEAPVTITKLEEGVTTKRGPVESILARITINSDDVIKRIQDLEERRSYGIVRDRTGERLSVPFPFTTAAAAREYLDEQDYNVFRFNIVPDGMLDSDDQAELDLLRGLDADGRRAFGEPQWITGVLLRNESFYDADWARDLAVTRLGIRSYRLGEWPLSLITSWDDAAKALLANEYAKITFGGTDYWGKDSE
jgi:hypothetical protein